MLKSTINDDDLLRSLASIFIEYYSTSTLIQLKQVKYINAIEDIGIQDQSPDHLGLF